MLQDHIRSLLPFPDKSRVPFLDFFTMDKVTTLSPFLPELHENRYSEATKYHQLGASVQRLILAHPLKILSRKTNTTFPKCHPVVQEDLLGIQAPFSHDKSLGTKSILPARRFSGALEATAQVPATTRYPEPPRQPLHSSACLQPDTPVFPALHPTYRRTTHSPTTGHTVSIVCVPGRRRSLAAFSHPCGAVLRLERSFSVCRLLLRPRGPFRICSPHRIRSHSPPPTFR